MISVCYCTVVDIGRGDSRILSATTFAVVPMLSCHLPRITGGDPLVAPISNAIGADLRAGKGVGLRSGRGVRSSSPACAAAKAPAVSDADLEYYWTSGAIMPLRTRAVMICRLTAALFLFSAASGAQGTEEHCHSGGSAPSSLRNRSVPAHRALRFRRRRLEPGCRRHGARVGPPGCPDRRYRYPSLHECSRSFHRGMPLSGGGLRSAEQVRAKKTGLPAYSHRFWSVTLPGQPWSSATAVQAPPTLSRSHQSGLLSGFVIDQPLCRGNAWNGRPALKVPAMYSCRLRRVEVPWFALQGMIDQVCDTKSTEAMSGK